MTHRRDPEDLPQAKNPHPDEYRRDLNPEHLGGQNIGVSAADLQPGSVAASDVKDAVIVLRDFDMNELREIPVLEHGARLKQGATYLDLNDPMRKPFTAEGAMIAEIDQLLVPKSETPYEYWNRLIGEPKQ